MELSKSSIHSHLPTIPALPVHPIREPMPTPANKVSHVPPSLFIPLSAGPESRGLLYAWDRRHVLIPAVDLTSGGMIRLYIVWVPCFLQLLSSGSVCISSDPCWVSGYLSLMGENEEGG